LLNAGTASITHSDGLSNFQLSELSAEQVRTLNGTSLSVQIDPEWKDKLEKAQKERIAQEKQEQEARQLAIQADAANGGASDHSQSRSESKGKRHAPPIDRKLLEIVQSNNDQELTEVEQLNDQGLPSDQLDALKYIREHLYRVIDHSSGMRYIAGAFINNASGVMTIVLAGKMTAFYLADINPDKIPVNDNVTMFDYENVTLYTTFDESNIQNALCENGNVRTGTRNLVELLFTSAPERAENALHDLVVAYGAKALGCR